MLLNTTTRFGKHSQMVINYYIKCLLQTAVSIEYRHERTKEKMQGDWVTSVYDAERLSDGGIEPVVLNSVSTVVDNHSRYQAWSVSMPLDNNLIYSQSDYNTSKFFTEDYLVDKKWWYHILFYADLYLWLR